MHEIETIRYQLAQYRAVLSLQVDRLYNALEELQRTTLLLLGSAGDSDEKIDEWLQREGFAVDEDGFFQSRPLLAAFRNGTAPAEAVSLSWGQQRRTDDTARRHLYCHRTIGPHLKHIHDRLGDVGWIYYQDSGNTALQYPYIDQRTAIPSDFDWTSYHTFVSVCPENNPHRQIRWTPPTIDYAGEGVILSVSIPVWSDERFIGLWSIDLPLRYLYRDFASAKTFPDQEQFIVNQDGMLVLHEKLQVEVDQTRGRVFLHRLAELGGQWVRFDLAAAISREDGVTPVRDADGKEWLFCCSKVAGVEWTLFCGLPRTALEEAAAQRLSEAFRQIGDGNFSHRIESSYASALPVIVDEFNKMSRRLGEAERLRRTMETQLRQAQKMEAVGRLAGGVAHDYNNMINVILGYAEMALENLGEDDPLYTDLQAIHEAARRSMELTRQLLAFARRQSIAPRLLDLDETVPGMLTMLQRLIGENIDIVWSPGGGLWPVEIDPSQVDQLLANLCVNARDAIDGAGRITIETENIELDDDYCELHRGALPGEYVRLAVSDDGCGMDAAIIGNIFEPFFSTKGVGRGTGLGLATVYGIVKQNGGYIEVSSEPGHGASFSIYLPRASGRPVEATADPADVAECVADCGHHETVLLVEDEGAMLDLVKRMLVQLGYRVLATASAAEAVALAERQPEGIDLLITDVIMPELNGSDLADRLRRRFPDLAVLFISGYPANIINRSGIFAADVSLIQKPFSRMRLAATIRAVLDQKNNIID